MNAIQTLLTDHLDIWTSALLTKSTAGRGSNGKLEAYGIKKLRALILELAVRGKLVPQDPNDEPASVLLGKITKEKARLMKAGKIKQEKPFPEVDVDDTPYVIPANWEWARFPNIASYKPGKTPSTKNPSYWSENPDDVPWVSISDMEHFGVLTETSKKITPEAAKNVFGYEPIPKGSLLMSFKLTVGKMAILGVDAYHNEAILSIQPYSGIVRDYLLKVLPTRAQEGNTKRAIMGDTLNSTSLALLLIPVPPLAEQHRIVAKVDELMALCDQLEQQQTHSLAAHQTLVEILLGTLTRVESQQEFSAAWARIASHFDTLFTTEASIDQLKQTLLQLAVMGKLVPQDPNDEPARALLKRIQAEKAKLIAEGKIKKDKPLAAITEDEKPFELPQSWEWICLSDLMPEFQNGVSSRGDKDGKPITVLRLADIKNRRISLADTRTIPINSRDIEKYQLLIGDILITRVNGSADIVGSFVLNDAGVEAIYCDHFIRMRIAAQWINADYLCLLGDSSLVRNKIQSLFITTAGQKTVNQGHIGSLPIALPPFAEQHRIVVKVDELMALCDALKARLADAQAIQLHLADAIVEQAVC